MLLERTFDFVWGDNMIISRCQDFLKRKERVEYFWKLRNGIQNSGGIWYYILKYRYKKLMRSFNADIPTDTSIAGIPTFPHGLNGIFISAGAKIGEHCTIFHQVTIGSNTLKDSKNPGSPIIGDDVFIGAGAKIIGGITVGNHVRIGANCVVTKNIPDNTTVVLQAPRIILYEEKRTNTFVSFGEFHKTDLQN